MRNCVAVIVYTFMNLVQGAVDWRDVEIGQGTVRGHLVPGGGLYEFYNIPYATAPTGPNKFKAPLPPPVFLTTFDAVDRSIICPQPGGKMNMREDCLVANVFIPNTTTAEISLPVQVIVHGGAYQYGNGEQEKYKELAKTKKVIVVTFNYRLGVHGFLCLGTEGAPGNAGLKDQVALLHWVNTNIRSFGGDPDDVTVTGSVAFLTLASITKGMFKKSVMDSGVSTGAVGLQIDPIENAKTYAKLLGFNGEDLNSLENFYKSATFQQLLMRHNDQDTIRNIQDVVIVFGPCVEPDQLKDDHVLDGTADFWDKINDKLYSSPMEYFTKKRTTRRPTTKRTTKKPIVTSAPNFTTSKPVTGGTNDTGIGGLNPPTRTTSSSNTTISFTTSSSLNVTNTTNTTTTYTEWTTFRPIIVIPTTNTPAASGAAKSVIFSNVMLMVVSLHFYFR